MIPPHSLFVAPGRVVLGACAAPGSKTAQIVEALNGAGCVVANDGDSRRCHSLVHQSSASVGRPWNSRVWDSAQFLEFQRRQFDRVLCNEALCSSPDKRSTILIADRNCRDGCGADSNDVETIHRPW
jgi:16S rRNA C967 or C1407 C5-methylase (RsmB/RsmF family)